MKTITKTILGATAIATLSAAIVSAVSAHGWPGMDMHRGMMQPGTMQPGMMQPGMMQPGMMQPGMMQPGMMQPGTMRPGMMRHQEMMGRGMHGDPKAMVEQQLARLRAELAITPQQEPAWDAFANALKGRAELMVSHRQSMMENGMPAGEQHADMMRSGAAQMQKVAQAAEAFYGTLTSEQRGRMERIMGGHFQ